MSETVATQFSESLDRLRGSVAGGIFLPHDDGFAANVAAFNLLVMHRPEVLVAATSESDVIAAVRFASENSLAVRIFSTGHGSYAAVTDGVLITTSGLKGLSIDPEARIAGIGAGHRWSDVIPAAAEFGLAPVVGSSANVSAVGYTLGGGIGPLSRTFGFTTDWVRSFRIVTADGEAITASATEHPDLFWALRGGKGGFGVVTSMQIELVPLETLYAGSLFFTAEHIASVFRAWVDWTKTVPESVTSSAAIFRFPPLDIIPEPLRGKTVLSVRYAFIGDPAEGARLLQPIRDVAPALIDGIAEMPASDVPLIHSDPTTPIPLWDGSVFVSLTDVGAGFADAFLAVAGPHADVPLAAAEVRHLGGASRRDVPGGSAVGGRDADYTLLIAGIPDPSLFEAVLPQMTASMTEHLAPWLTGTTQVNFLTKAGVIPRGYAAAWPADVFARLAEVRERYDPDGRFPFGARAQTEEH